MCICIFAVIDNLQHAYALLKFYGILDMYILPYAYSLFSVYGIWTCTCICIYGLRFRDTQVFHYELLGFTISKDSQLGATNKLSIIKHFVRKDFN